MRRKLILLLALLICIPISACNGCDGTKANNNQSNNNQTINDQTTNNQKCTCTEYPFTANCTSVCKLTEYVVQSVNHDSVVVRTAEANGVDERTIPLSSLPQQQIQGLKPGSRVQVLSKVENGKPVEKSFRLMTGPASKMTEPASK